MNPGRPESLSVIADRVGSIAPFRVVELLERAKQLEAAGHSVVHFEVGEPDFPTAEPIVTAAHRALVAGATKYTQAQGIPELRERISEFYRETAGVRVPASRIVVTAGASGGLLLLNALLLNPGDELLLCDPGYPCNEVFAHLVNARPVRIPLAAATGFQLTAEQVRAAWSAATRALLVASPANPTGAVLPAQELGCIATVVRERGGALILDEIYQGLTYSRQPGDPDYSSGLQVTEDLYLLNSFSKYFGMTGWRLGWMVVPEAALEPLARLAQNLFISPPSLAQHAALAAFEPAAMAIHETRRGAFEERRDLLLEGLRTLGFHVPLCPAGAFYLYADISHTGMAAPEFCSRLLEEHHVATTPGIDFGRQHAERYVRFAFTTGQAETRLRLERLERALQAWRRSGVVAR